MEYNARVESPQVVALPVPRQAIAVKHAPLKEYQELVVVVLLKSS